MTRIHLKLVLATVLGLAFASIACAQSTNSPSKAQGEQIEVSTNDPLIGTWSLVSAQTEQDGKKIDIFGPNPTGAIMFDGHGHFAQQLLRSSLPKFVSNNRMQGTQEENKAVVQGVIAYYGTYTISEPGIVKLHIVSCSFPNWNGTDQARAFVIAGDEMQYTNPTTSFGGSSGRLAWKRVSAGTMTQP